VFQGSGEEEMRRLLSTTKGDWLRASNVSAKIRNAEYAVRGPIVLRALNLDKLIKSGKGASLPSKDVIFCNIGNPQALGQPPLTFPRQVLSALVYPKLLENEATAATFPKDVKERAKKYLKNIPGGVGAYSESQGLQIVRDEVAEFLKERDGIETSPADIYLTAGASSAVQMIISMMISEPQDALMIPIPQYPLYSATIAMCGGQGVGYYLDEDSCWGFSADEVENAIGLAKTRDGLRVKGLVLINPGNPTGQCVSEEMLERVLLFCNKHQLVLFADEVYQENVYSEGKKFVSCRTVLNKFHQQGKLLDQQLVSFHSVSKGFIGECGMRGGFMHVTGFEESVKMEIYKQASTALCSNVTGQLMVGLMINPPKPGDESFELYNKEKTTILSSLQRRASKLAKALNDPTLEGLSCTEVQGAMYAFPQVTLPPKAIQEAKKEGQQPDTFYCIKLLEATGIVVVPGSGFKQKENTWHFRTTILPPEDQMESVIERLTSFHREFMKKYQ
jgi:alanine transaminase